MWRIQDPRNTSTGTMLLALAAAHPAGRPRPTTRLAGPPQLLASSEAERRERLKQLFGGEYKDELARVTKVEQPKQNEAPAPPEWTLPKPEGEEDVEWSVKRMTLWLEDNGVNMEQVLLVRNDDGRISAVTAQNVRAGTMLFEVPDNLLVTADVALANPDVGRDLRALAAKDPGAGFETFAIGAMLAAERVRRGSVRGRLRREGGVPLSGGVLPKWQVEAQSGAQTNLAFSPFIASLAWPSEEECVVEVERAEAVNQGSALIAKFIEPAARNACERIWIRIRWARGPSRHAETACTASHSVSHRTSHTESRAVGRSPARGRDEADAGQGNCAIDLNRRHSLHGDAGPPPRHRNAARTVSLATRYLH